MAWLRAVQGADETGPPCWRRWAGTPMNVRQIKRVNRLLVGFEGKPTSPKWAAAGLRRLCDSHTASAVMQVWKVTGKLRPAAIYL
jgi:hypothetical protein